MKEIKDESLTTFKGAAGLRSLILRLNNQRRTLESNYTQIHNNKVTITHLSNALADATRQKECLEGEIKKLNGTIYEMTLSSNLKSTQLHEAQCLVAELREDIRTLNKRGNPRGVG